jgi:hypothetical protein
MTALLSKAGSSLTVKQLLDPLVVVVEFEASMVKKYGTPVSRHIFFIPTLLVLNLCM